MANSTNRHCFSDLILNRSIDTLNCMNNDKKYKYYSCSIKNIDYNDNGIVV